MPCNAAPAATTIAMPAAAASASVAPATHDVITASTAIDPIALAARRSSCSAGLFTRRRRQPRSSCGSRRPSTAAWIAACHEKASVSAPGSPMRRWHGLGQQRGRDRDDVVGVRYLVCRREVLAESGHVGDQHRRPVDGQDQRGVRACRPPRARRG